MRTKLNPDDEFFIPDVSGVDWSKAEVGRYAKAPGEKTEIGIDGAVGYSLRLIPSNRILARFESTLQAWPVIIRTIEGGRSPRTLSLDWNGDDGRSGSICAGLGLEGFARANNGEPHPYPSHVPATARRRVAEGAD